MADGIDARQSPFTYYLMHTNEPGPRALEGHAHRRVKIRGRAPEVFAMTTWKRWQDWSVVVLGAIMFVTPFVFGDTSQSVAASAAYVLGVLVALGGLLNVAMDRAGALELVPGVLGVILFVSPWLFGFASVTAIAWFAWIVAVLVVLAIGSQFAMRTRPTAA